MVDGANDWALVVGIAAYPNYGKTPAEPNDLRAPINDAKAVAKFLGDDLGVKNITLLTSLENNGANWPDKLHPIRADIEGWLRNIALLSDDNVSKGKGPQIGRRLYIYVSGHGLATERFRRALVTANALSRVFIDHVLFTSWQESLSNSQFFSEYVLFLDFCSQAEVTLVPSPPPFQITKALDPPAPQVIACAAKYPLQAIELPLGDNGEYHSVFTYELLRGLRRGAINPVKGGIRTRDLEAYLYTAVAAHIDKLQDKDKRGISREPDFLSSDDIEFVSPRTAPPASRLRTIKLPDLADGTPVTITDHARNQLGTANVAGGAIEYTLVAGLYKLDWGQDHCLVEIVDEIPDV